MVSQKNCPRKYTRNQYDSNDPFQEQFQTIRIASEKELGNVSRNVSCSAGKCGNDLCRGEIPAARRGAAGFTCLQSGKLGEPGLMELTKTRKDANKSVASRCNECVRMKRQKSGLKMGQRIRLLVNPDCERAFITATPGEARGARGEVPDTMENPSCLCPAQLFSIEVTMSRCRFPSNYVSCEFLPSRASNGFFPSFSYCTL